MLNHLSIGLTAKACLKGEKMMGKEKEDQSHDMSMRTSD